MIKAEAIRAYIKTIDTEFTIKDIINDLSSETQNSSLSFKIRKTDISYAMKKFRKENTIRTIDNKHPARYEYNEKGFSAVATLNEEPVLKPKTESRLEPESESKPIQTVTAVEIGNAVIALIQELKYEIASKDEHITKLRKSHASSVNRLAVEKREFKKKFQDSNDKIVELKRAKDFLEEKVINLNQKLSLTANGRTLPFNELKIKHRQGSPT